ncbi:KIF-binding protein [Caenorhabditis elegans]|uniref:KIF-binding protein n=1 Tax=Caenorhabditis elegans TaxID=6239 RepID=Q9GYN8_CAEEL|nr:KIF-binding protein [Caenorhabditis elegans]CCD67198.1 KIF-binding protein [Caenorhabditis elegans]|eukprot:NP_508430.1 Uncharacterized protein CELE_F47G3.3 [Caenorhabditis elegans]
MTDMESQFEIIRTEITLGNLTGSLHTLHQNVKLQIFSDDLCQAFDSFLIFFHRSVSSYMDKLKSQTNDDDDDVADRLSAAEAHVSLHLGRFVAEIPTFADGCDVSGFWHSLLVKLINEMFGFSHKTFDPAAKVKNKNAISALFEEFLAAEKPDRSTAYEYICVMYIKYLQQMNLHAELELFAAEKIAHPHEYQQEGSSYWKEECLALLKAADKCTNNRLRNNLLTIGKRLFNNTTANISKQTEAFFAILTYIDLCDNPVTAEVWTGLRKICKRVIEHGNEVLFFANNENFDENLKSALKVFGEVELTLNRRIGMIQKLERSDPQDGHQMDSAFFIDYGYYYVMRASIFQSAKFIVGEQEAKEQTALDIKQASDYSYHYTNVQIAINDVLELITSNFENLSETSLVEMGIYQYLESIIDACFDNRRTKDQQTIFDKANQLLSKTSEMLGKHSNSSEPVTSAMDASGPSPDEHLADDNMDD